MTAGAVPERVPAIVTTGAWDPWLWDPAAATEEDWRWFDEDYAPALRRGGTRALVDLWEQEAGEAFERELAWAQAVPSDCQHGNKIAFCAACFAARPERW